MGLYESVGQKPLRDLLNEIHTGSARLPEFTIDSGYTENLEIWMSYFEEIEAKESKVVEKIQRASELAARLASIASGIRHLPQIKLK